MMTELLHELKLALLDGLYGGVSLATAIAVLILFVICGVGFVEYVVKRLL